MDSEYPLDINGNEVCPGDVIVYPNRLGSSMWLISAKVLESGVKMDGLGRPAGWAKVEVFATADYNVEPASYKTTISSFPRVAKVCQN